MSISFQEQFEARNYPAGEAGMCFETDRCPMFFYWDGKERGGRKDSPAEAYADRGGLTSILQWRWATLAELLASGLSEAEALPMLHKSQLPHPKAEPAEVEKAEPVAHLTAEEKVQAKPWGQLGETDDGPMVDRDCDAILHGKWDRFNARKAQEPAEVAPPAAEEPTGLDVVAPLSRIGSGWWGL